MARLRIIGGDGVEQLVELRDRRVQIGRGRDNDIILPDPEKGVSRTHAELRLENDRYVILDLQSQNGTWLNGRRVERAAVPFGAEIAIGAYRLSLLNTGPSAAEEVAVNLRADPHDDMRATARHDPPPLPVRQAARPSPGVPRWALGVALAAVVIIALAVVRWVSEPRETPAVPASSAAASGADGGTPSPGDTPPTQEPPPEPGGERPAPSVPTDPSPAGRRSGGKALSGVARSPGARGIGHRPGESTETWRARGAALQMRYGYSRAALERGDFAAAAGGFEAILLEEPGFLDAPQLLVEAQSGLRSSARGLFQAGKKLDAAGDWVGALQKYEQARQISSQIPGVADGIQRVRGKLRAAGVDAFDRARQHEANGRPQEAVKEYEKAIQWLPPDDPNRQIARARLEQIRRND